MAKESLLKQLLTGDLSVLKNDDPSLIDDFIVQFQILTSKDKMAADMMFIRACHFNSIKVVNAMLEKGLISGVDLYDQTGVKAAIGNDSIELLECLKKFGASLSNKDHDWLLEASIQGAVSCLPIVIKAVKESGVDIFTLNKQLDRCTVHLVRNEKKVDQDLIVQGLKLLVENGATLSGASQNILSNAVLAHRYCDMSNVVDLIIEHGVTEQAIRSARSALSRLIDEISNFNHNTPNLARFDPISHFKSTKDRVERAAQGLAATQRRNQPLANLS